MKSNMSDARLCRKYFYLLVVCLITLCRGQKSSIQLLRYDDSSKTLHLDPDALTQLSALAVPVTVVAAIGDARVGKSTTLNHVQRLLQGNSNGDVTKVFQTSNQMKPCTQGVWMSVTNAVNGGSMVLLDVEGSNLGNDTRTTQYSIFTALMSSGLMLFGEGGLTNHNRDFLFRLTRVTEEIWRDELREAAMNHFPGLRIILKQPLKPPQGTRLSDFIKQSLVGKNDDVSRVLKKYFPEDRLSVSSIVHVKELKKSAGNNGLTNNKYKQDITDLVSALKLVPAKKTPSGALMNGQMLNDLATKIVYALNKNSWVSLADTFTALEKSLCDKAFNSLINPMHSSSHHVITSSKADVLNQFDKQCVLEAERRRARRWLEGVIRDKKNAEEKERMIKEQREKQEAEAKKQREINAKRAREEQLQKQRMEQERERREVEERRLREEKARARHAEEQRREAERRSNELNELNRLQQKKARKAKKKANAVAAGIGIAIGALALLSDNRLKDNITTIRGSQYEAIGLRGVRWVWNEEAQTLGLRGRGEGVVAQEVEAKYPHAVTEGHDGYKRVDYELLHDILVKKDEIGIGIGDEE